MSNPAVYDSRTRDGLASLRKFARLICGVTSWAAPIIELKYRNNAAVLALLAACQEVCNLLPAADAALIEGGANDEILDDPLSIPGIDPAAPAPPAPPAS